MAKDLITGLTLRGSSSLGKDLIEQAQESNRRELSEKVTATVRDLLRQIQGEEQRKSLAEANLRSLRERVRAIEKGEFEIDNYGNLKLLDDKLAPLGITK